MPFKGLQLIAQFNFQRATGCLNTRKSPARLPLWGTKKPSADLILQLGIWDTFALNANRLYFIRTDCQQIILLNQPLVPFQKNVMKMRDFPHQRKSYFNYFHLPVTNLVLWKWCLRNLLTKSLLQLNALSQNHTLFTNLVSVFLICE